MLIAQNSSGGTGRIVWHSSTSQTELKNRTYTIKKKEIVAHLTDTKTQETWKVLFYH
jgi:hypothetical protein